MVMDYMVDNKLWVKRRAAGWWGDIQRAKYIIIKKGDMIEQERRPGRKV